MTHELGGCKVLGRTVTIDPATGKINPALLPSSGALSDGDYGDIVVSGSGTSMMLDATLYGTSIQPYSAMLDAIQFLAVGGSAGVYWADGAGTISMADASLAAVGDVVSWDGSKFVISTPTAGSVTITETELDFGSTPVWSKSFTISPVVGVTASSKVMVTPGTTATGGSADDMEWDSITYNAVPGTEQFTIYASAFPGPIKGKRKVNYLIG